jgi:hypothetical protein
MTKKRFGRGEGRREAVAQTMYTQISKYKNDKIKEIIYIYGKKRKRKSLGLVEQFKW